LRSRLQHHDGADEEAGHEDDGERADADVVHLIEDILKITRAGGEIGERLAGELEVILDVEDEALGGVGQDFDHGNLFNWLRVVCRELERGVGHSGYGWMTLQAKGL
jgi:hypothetical protein